VKYLLDTDHLSFLQRGSGAEFSTLMSRMSLHRPADFCLSIVSMHEQLLGCHTYIARARSTGHVVRGYELLKQVLSSFVIAEVASFDAAAGNEFERLRGLRLGVATMDLRIAAIALSRGLIVLTRNSRDFERIPDLRCEDWT
jgi:tRNA(fMet)-specific endonuclease VapC